ncbi:hypothetical protein LIN78_01865 [Leeia sp. TBRC 13508]|uniref:Tail fiber protein n=1 Tax=Leeia speluncae TaxID=2884804 RepID=A0ABS8D293_9NEIS|nr:hypothetical protein [Leeia speluncae]MCB6182301.1 hypothetical protein [Leeia speluncae]
MQRVRRDTAVAVIPAPPATGTPGYFGKGDPQSGQSATIPGYEWFNSVQEELCGVIEALGLTLADADRTQLLQALKLLQGSDVLYNKTVHTTVANGSPVYWDSANSRYDLAKADGTSAANFIGFARNVSAGKADIVIGGYVSGLAGLTAGKVYLSTTTAGALTSTLTSVPIGLAISAAEILLRQDISAYANLALTQLWTKAQRGQVLALADAASIAVDLSLSNNFSITLAGNRTLATPTNVVPGQSGIIAVTQDATGSRTLAFGTNYKFAGGSAPTLTTTANATDYLTYYAETATRVFVSIVKDVK